MLISPFSQDLTKDRISIQDFLHQNPGNLNRSNDLELNRSDNSQSIMKNDNLNNSKQISIYSDNEDEKCEEQTSKMMTQKIMCNPPNSNPISNIYGPKPKSIQDAENCVKSQIEVS